MPIIEETEGQIVFTVGEDDTDYGIVVDVPGEDFPRVKITKAGVATGNGSTDPTVSTGGAATEQEAPLTEIAPDVWVATVANGPNRLSSDTELSDVNALIFFAPLPSTGAVIEVTFPPSVISCRPPSFALNDGTADVPGNTIDIQWVSVFKPDDNVVSNDVWHNGIGVIRFSPDGDTGYIGEWISDPYSVSSKVTRTANAGGIAATDVEAALIELKGDIDSLLP